MRQLNSSGRLGASLPACFLLLLVVIGAADSQELPPASVSGTVMNASTQAPFGGVLVMVSGGGVATTDETGQYVIKGIPPGTHTLQAIRTGMAPPVGEPSLRSISVEPGEDLRNVRLWLAPYGVITGKISDLDDKPLKDLRVLPLIFSYGFPMGTRTLTAPPSPSTGEMFLATTNGNGEYRLEVPPGKYYVAADYVPSGVAYGYSSAQPARPDVPRSYYPGTLDSRLAATLTINGGETITANFRASTKAPEVVKISGAVVSSLPAELSKTPPGETTRQLMLIPKNPAGPNGPLRISSIGRPRSERFEMSGIPRGFYDLLVTDQLPDKRAGRGIVSVEITDRDIDNITVVLEPGQNVDGKVLVRGAKEQFPMESLEIRGDAFAKPATDGTFTLPNILQGPHAIGIDGLPLDAYVVDIRQGSVSLFDEARTLYGPEFVGGSSATPLEIIVSANGGVIDGVVEAPTRGGVAGSTVVLIPGQARRFVQSYYRSAVVNRSGQFMFQGLAPGTYRLFAWESVPPNAWFNSDFMTDYEGRGTTITVEAGRHMDAKIRAIPRDN